MVQATGSCSSRRRQRQAEEGLQQLQLPDAGDAAERQAAIPEDEADQHAEDRDIGEADPGRRADRRSSYPGMREQRDDRHHRQRQHQRPGDHLPAAEPARQRRALGIAEAAEQDRGHHQQIARDRAAVAVWTRAKPATVAAPRTENSQKAGFGRSPPRRTPKIAVASGSRPMKTIECAEVMCWSASAVSSGKPTTTPSATMASETRDRARRPRLPERDEQGRAEQRGDHRAGRGQEQRREVADRDARRRQRAAEDDDAQEAAAPAVRRSIHVTSLSAADP